jgi:hypothetical protein
MLDNKDYCDTETSDELEKLGYPRYHYDATETDKIFRIITLYEAQKWLREEKEVYVTVLPEYNEFGPVKGVKYRLEVAHWKDDEFGYETIEWLDEECPHTIITFDSYEEALSEGIKEAVKILKGEDND